MAKPPKIEATLVGKVAVAKAHYHGHGSFQRQAVMAKAAFVGMLPRLRNASWSYNLLQEKKKKKILLLEKTFIRENNIPKAKAAPVNMLPRPWSTHVHAP